MYSWTIGPWTGQVWLLRARKRFYVEDIPDCGPVFWFADALEFT